MSTAAAAEKPEGSGFIAWLAHHEWVLYLAMGVELVAYLVNGMFQAMGVPTTWLGLIRIPATVGAPLAWIWGVTFLILLVIGVTATILTTSVGTHFERLCEGCISAMPLNGPELAAKRKRTMLVHHFPYIAWEWLRAKLGGSYKFAIIVTTLLHTIVLIGLCFLASWLFQATSLGVAIVIAMSIILGWMQIRHRPIIPWCKWCNEGRGRGPREHVCDPPPLPTISPEPVKVG